MSNLLIACLCAEWCDTCGVYRTEFEALGRELVQHRFIWIDIEDEADLVGHIEVENFPTLLVAHGENLLFAGTILPQIGRLRRMLLAMNEKIEPRVGKLSAAEFTAFQSLAARLHESRP